MKSRGNIRGWGGGSAALTSARWYANAIKLDRSRAIAYLNLGDAYARNSERDKARAAYQTYLELSPQGPQAVYAKQQIDKL